MARRPPQTLGDYLVIGISPALIMLLVGSLLFFLVEVFYQGDYQFRLSFIFAMFVMATVAVARISMAEGAGYAALFGVPLALVTWIALMSFVEVKGAMAAISWLVNIFLIALVWWCSHKLTWDCTLIDDSQDASGQGLLQSMGLDGEAEAESRPKVKLSFWERWFGPKKKQARPPGLSVIYFSLAALPLYGVGQWFIAADSRWYSFCLLVVYVASGLALLLTTSFLGLRRYLRQRQLEMPSDMAFVWVMVGSVMIAALLIVCILLPRPGAENPISRLPFEFSSPIKSPSKWGFGNDGPQDNKLGTRTGPQSKNDGQTGQGSGKSGQGSGQKGQGPGNQQSPGQSQAPGQSPTPGQPPSQGPSQTPGQPPTPGQGQSLPPASGQNSRSQSGNLANAHQPQPGGQNNSSSPTPSGGPNQPGERPRGSNLPGEKTSSPNSMARNDRPPEPPKPANSRSDASNSSSGFVAQAMEWVGWFVGSVFKLIIYTMVALAVGYFAWRYRREIMAALRKLLDELCDLWNRLFGKKSRTAAAGETGPSLPVYKRFADFSDPFASGLASRFSPVELVRYTFEAVEAWGREHNCPRAPQQTPHEFAERLGGSQVALAKDAPVLAELYCRAAYAGGALPPQSIDHLQQVWRVLGAAV